MFCITDQSSFDFVFNHVMLCKNFWIAALTHIAIANCLLYFLILFVIILVSNKKSSIWNPEFIRFLNVMIQSILIEIASEAHWCLCTVIEFYAVINRVLLAEIYFLPGMVLNMFQIVLWFKYLQVIIHFVFSSGRCS